MRPLEKRRRDTFLRPLVFHEALHFIIQHSTGTIFFFNLIWIYISELFECTFLGTFN